MEIEGIVSFGIEAAPGEKEWVRLPHQMIQGSIGVSAGVVLVLPPPAVYLEARRLGQMLELEQLLALAH